MEKLEKKELQKVFWRSFTLLGSMNYERMQGLGFAYSLMPALKKIYKEDKSGLAQALERHMAVFNTAVAPATFIMGVSLAMEEEKQMNPDFDASSINTVKAALMGPLAGIGDAFFWGVFRIVAAGIGVSFSLKGNLLGPIIFLILYNIRVKYYGLFLGYKQGSSLLTKWSKSGMLDRIVHCAGVLGVMVIGSMIATMVDITTPLKITLEGSKIDFQKIFDQIMPKLLPLLTTLGIYQLIKNNVKMSYIMLIILAVGFVGSLLGLL